MLTFLAVYTVLYALLVRGLTGFDLDIGIFRDELINAAGGDVNAIITSLTLYGSLLSSLTATTDEITNFYQLSILVICSIAFIWLIRKLHGRTTDASVRSAFYEGMTPLVPFLGVLLLMVIMLLPVAIGSLLLATAQSSAAITGQAEIMVLSLVMILTAVLSAYLLAGSVFAFYIVTLPRTRPTVAVRSSLRLLRIHRWRVMSKVIGFYIALVVLGFLLVLPFIWWLPRYAEIAFFIMGCGSFAVMHTFLYKLYRSML